MILINKEIRFFIFYLFIAVGVFAQQPGSGYSLMLDGQNNKITYSNIYQELQLPVTITGWVYLPEDTPLERKVLFASSWPDSDIYSGIWISVGPESAAVTYGDGTGTNLPLYRRSAIGNFNENYAGNWIHVAYQCSGPTNMRIFLNGQEISFTYSGTSNLPMNSVPSGKCVIGHNTSANYVYGKVDQLEFWDYSLSTDEIRQSMCRKTDLVSGLIGLWDFDQGSGGTVEEKVQNEIGDIEGPIDWQLSGAPIGDESFFEYFPAGTKKKLFKNQTDSFWITTESENWIGYQVYKVNETPNSTQGSTIDFSNGYYGIFPIFNGEMEEYRVFAANAYCGALEYRNGNDDATWEIVDQKNDSMFVYQSTGISELIFFDGNTPLPLSSQYSICLGDQVDINAESDCATAYLWSTGSEAMEISIGSPGSYWLERTTESGVIRDDFMVSLIDLPQDLISNERYVICMGDFPIELTSEIDASVLWSTGEVDDRISITEPGIYWAEYQNGCGIVRDSVTVEYDVLDEPFIPNVITPNGDEKNDCFEVGEALLGSSLEVFNRAGVKIFATENYYNDWCPDIPSGVYYYTIFNTCNLKSYKGWLSVLL